MKPTRTSQPYRRGVGQPGAALAAMLLGGPTYLPNPKDVERWMSRKRRSATFAEAILSGLRP